MKCFKNVATIVLLAAMGTTQATAEIETNQNDQAACSHYIVTASILNVREQSGLTGKITDGLPKGKSICVSGFSGNWAKIDKGWVSSKYILVEPKVIEINKEIDQSDLNETKDEVEEKTKAPAINKEQGESEIKAEPLEAEISPPLPEDENKTKEEKVDKTTNIQEENKEAEKSEDASEAVEAKETEAAKEIETVAAEAKKTEVLAVEKKDTTTTNYLRQIRTQKGTRGTNYIYMIEGNGDKCELMVLEKNTILVNTCKPAINESGEKMLCTWNKKMCKTEAQILEDIKE